MLPMSGFPGLSIGNTNMSRKENSRVLLSEGDPAGPAHDCGNYASQLQHMLLACMCPILACMHTT